MALLDADLARRGLAARTRRAYAADLADLADWAVARELAPDATSLLAICAATSRRSPQRGLSAVDRRPARRRDPRAVRASFASTA